ncbi:MAG: hypothetical protein H7123_00425 [Thermoleophilia bacterium]|nr:hypothetical protein [Thermoleophilia bacterium]
MNTKTEGDETPPFDPSANVADEADLVEARTAEIKRLEALPEPPKAQIAHIRSLTKGLEKRVTH